MTSAQNDLGAPCGTTPLASADARPRAHGERAEPRRVCEQSCVVDLRMPREQALDEPAELQPFVKSWITLVGVTASTLTEIIFLIPNETLTSVTTCAPASSASERCGVTR